MSEMTFVENLGKIIDVPQLPQALVERRMQSSDPALVAFGSFDGSHPQAQRLIGVPGLLAPGDQVDVHRFILPDGRNIRPFRPRNPDLIHYVLPVDGEIVVRTGNSRHRRLGHLVTSGELLRMSGKGKRSIEAPRGVNARGFLFEVDTSQFNLAAFAEPHLHSEREGRVAAARWLMGEVDDSKRSVSSARDQIEQWNLAEQTAHSQKLRAR